MNGNLNIFEQALQKLAFRQPVPFESRRFALYNKRKALRLTLKKFGDYSIYYGLTLRIYFLSKRLGFSLSVLQCKIILFLTAAILCGTVYSGIIITSNIINAGTQIINNNTAYSPDYKKDLRQEMPVVDSRQATNERSINNKVNIRNRLGIERFTGEEGVNTQLDTITDEITELLIKRKGKGRIIDLRKGKKNKNINLLLSGSVEKLGNSYIITAKIINIEDSKIIFVTSDTAKNIDKIPDTISNIAKKTADEFE